ncbi:MAG: hypothetical protein IKF48_05575 [Oscillospiraceae bacterium]|nr:hypothetical protein [Oscillospiraceae bacterium]
MDRIDDVVDLFVFRLDAAPGAQALRRFLFASPAPTGSIIIVSEQADGFNKNARRDTCSCQRIFDTSNFNQQKDGAEFSSVPSSFSKKTFAAFSAKL